MGGDLAAAKAADAKAQMHAQSDSSSNSGSSVAEPSDGAGSQQDHAPSSQIWGGSRPRTPMSPQPDRNPRPILSRQPSKSAPNSPRAVPNVSFQTTQNRSPFSKAADEQTHRQTGEAGAVPGSMQIPGKALGTVREGSSGASGGLEGGVEGVSPPDGYMADSEHSLSRHRLHHSSVSFNDSGIAVLS